MNLYTAKTQTTHEKFIKRKGRVLCVQLSHEKSLASQYIVDNNFINLLLPLSHNFSPTPYDREHQKQFFNIFVIFLNV